MQKRRDGGPSRAGSGGSLLMAGDMLMAHGSGPLSPGPSPPEGGEGSLVDAEIKTRAGFNSSPARGGGPSQTMEGQVQGITTPEGQDDAPVPLPHASRGPPPQSGGDRGA